MKKIIALGNTEFTLGFQLAGVTSFRLNDESYESTLTELMSNKDIGLIILQQETIDKIDANMREKVSQSIEPLFLVLSVQDTNEELKKLIKKSIGVDLWDKK